MTRKKSPSQPVLDKRSKAIQAGLKTYAPNDTFRGVTEPIYAAKRASVSSLREQLQDAKDVVERLRIELQDDELDLWDMSGNVIDGVIGDERFGRNSALYGAFGLVRESERKSGLTRKGDVPAPAKRAKRDQKPGELVLPVLKPLELNGTNGNGTH